MFFLVIILLLLLLAYLAFNFDEIFERFPGLEEKLPKGEELTYSSSEQTPDSEQTVERPSLGQGGEVFGETIGEENPSGRRRNPYEDPG